MKARMNKTQQKIKNPRNKYRFFSFLDDMRTGLFDVDAVF
jgi:hypothetical protein